MHKPNQKDSDNDNEEIEQVDNSDKEEDYKIINSLTLT
jgi:hypothetical protein